MIISNLHDYIGLTLKEPKLKFMTLYTFFLLRLYFRTLIRRLTGNEDVPENKGIDLD